MTSRIDLFRANSIRVLAKVMDASMVAQMERFLKQALVDKNPFIMASTLCAGQHLFRTAPDVIRRWLAEIQEALNNKARMVQYHALGLLYRVKQHDKLAISKVVTALARSQQMSHSPMAQTLHIRLTANVLQTTPGPLNAELLKYLQDCLHNKHVSDAVTFDARAVA
jgi:coatomer protein complex subunit gamma